MVCFGAVLVDQMLDRSFYTGVKPISEKWVPEALAISGLSREETLTFAEPVEAMQKLRTLVAGARRTPRILHQ